MFASIGGAGAGGGAGGGPTTRRAPMGLPGADPNP
jgi:hypothetical protein